MVSIPLFHCCCGPFRTQVIKGATIVAIFGIVLCALHIFIRLMIEIICASSGQCSSTSHLVALGNSTFNAKKLTNFCFKHSLSYIQIGEMISIILFGMVILAQRRNNHDLYLPFLIFGALGLVLYTVMVAILVVGCVQMNSHAQNVVDMACLFTIAVTSASLILGFWSYSIVFRAYQVMKAQNMPVVQVLGMPSYPPPPLAITNKK